MFVGFNSILVRLKVVTDDNVAIDRISFNSILVRLKVGIGCVSMGSELMFQFHTGSIKRNGYRCGCGCVDWVSIPYWFD